MEKNLYIERMQQGQRFDDLFLVKSIKLGETKAGKPYLVITVMDKTGEVSGPVWDNVDQVRDICAVGDIVHLTGLVQSYRDQLQLRIESIDAVDREEVDHGSFYPTSHRSRDKMAEELQKLLRSVKNPYLRKLLHRFFKRDDRLALFLDAPAAKGIHHAYIGGLLEHSLSVAAIADFLSSHYEGIDRCLLITGALLHDIGKLEELKLDKGLVDYTVAGRLKGHLVIGSEMVAREAGRIKDFPKELLEQVQHLILSHHGRQEFGSPAVPMTVEAFMLSFLDDLDAKMNITEQLRRKIEGQEMGWTEYQRSLERFLYLGSIAGKKELESPPNKSAETSRQPTLF
ncbi:MAG: 3'-5' exoribonuclease YhaM family protein [Desulforhopalus sp.]